MEEPRYEPRTGENVGSMMDTLKPPSAGGWRKWALQGMCETNSLMLHKVHCWTEAHIIEHWATKQHWMMISCWVAPSHTSKGEQMKVFANQATTRKKTEEAVNYQEFLVIAMRWRLEFGIKSRDSLQMKKYLLTEHFKFVKERVKGYPPVQTEHTLHEHCHQIALE